MNTTTCNTLPETHTRWIKDTGRWRLKELNEYRWIGVNGKWRLKELVDSEKLEVEKGEWVIPNKMHVQHTIHTEGLLDLQTKIDALPNKYFTKNSRLPSHKGQLNLGWTCFAGQQTTAICSKPAAYHNKAHPLLEKEQPELLNTIQHYLDFMWSETEILYPIEVSNMKKTSPFFCFGETGYTKVSIGTNFDALWHVDKDNQKNGIQAVFVFGHFEGGEVSFDLAGRTGKWKKVNSEMVDFTKSLGNEEDVLIVPNHHGTLYIGSYKSIWHMVNKVTKGQRTIIAAYAREDVKVFDRAIQQHYSPEDAVALLNKRVKSLRNISKEHAAEHKAAGCNSKKCVCSIKSEKKKLKEDWMKVDARAIPRSWWCLDY